MQNAGKMLDMRFERAEGIIAGMFNPERIEHMAKSTPVKPSKLAARRSINIVTSLGQSRGKRTADKTACAQDRELRHDDSR